MRIHCDGCSEELDCWEIGETEHKAKHSWICTAVWFLCYWVRQVQFSWREFRRKYTYRRCDVCKKAWIKPGYYACTNKDCIPF